MSQKYWISRYNYKFTIAETGPRFSTHCLRYVSKINILKIMRNEIFFTLIHNAI